MNKEKEKVNLTCMQNIFLLCEGKPGNTLSLNCFQLRICVKGLQNVHILSQLCFTQRPNVLGRYL